MFTIVCTEYGMRFSDQSFSFFFSVDIIGVSFEQRVYFTTESAGSVTICAVTNVTLNGTQITTIVLETEDVTAQGWSIVFLHKQCPYHLILYLIQLALTTLQ